MKIAILGTGGVGKAFATRLTDLGHEVCVGTRDVSKTLEKDGEAGFKHFQSLNPKVKLATFSDAAAFGEIVINVSKGANTMDVIKAASSNLKGKVLVDISNPLDFSNGMPPSLIPEYSNTNSLGEEIQKYLPDTKVVKTLNTMWNGLMINPALIGNGDHVNYICGNDTEAKKKVISLLNEFGWKKESLLDLGDINAARATEAVLPIWLRVYGAKQSGAFNFKIVS
ncbi:NADPH-dependent F420 reductase [Aurantibacillus circumpalustris]|uniref:NADPH-dependent F420 reductase n=1 Tax=Aurantibacillus circumpalustris TaxID=3036359 RepID=UPI00295B6EC8|nr:NAD(P)-binding domain-containing protein [Aurantibacillus circumpalustris]